MDVTVPLLGLLEATLEVGSLRYLDSKSILFFGYQPNNKCLFCEPDLSKLKEAKVYPQGLTLYKERKDNQAACNQLYVIS